MAEFLSYFLTLGALAFLIFTLRHWQPWKLLKPKMVGFAEVLERRVEYRIGWKYFVTFSLSGLEEELEVSEETYFRLPESTRGQLVWREGSFLDFIKE